MVAKVVLVKVMVYSPPESPVHIPDLFGRHGIFKATLGLYSENGVVVLMNDQVWFYPRDSTAAPHRIEAVTMPRVAQAYLLHEFYTAVTEGIAPATTCQDNIKSLAIVCNLVESFQTGKVVEM